MASEGMSEGRQEVIRHYADKGAEHIELTPLTANHHLYECLREIDRLRARVAELEQENEGLQDQKAM